MFINKLVEIICEKIDDIYVDSIHPSQRTPPGLLENVQTPDMISKHFRNTVYYIQRKKELSSGAVGAAATASAERWDEVDVMGALVKMGLTR
jgi:vacuolar protein sorting-associated protein 35